MSTNETDDDSAGESGTQEGEEERYVASALRTARDALRAMLSTKSSSDSKSSE